MAHPLLRASRISALAVHVLLFAPPAALAQTSSDPLLRVETVVSGIELPTSLAFLARDDMLVLEKQTGRVRRVLDGVLLPEPVLDLAVNFAGERGLLGIAINRESPPAVFLYFTAQLDPRGLGRDRGAGFLPLGNHVVRYDWNPDAGILENPERILELPDHPLRGCHKGGVLALGPPRASPSHEDAVRDGANLYVLIGDLCDPRSQTTNLPDGDAPDDRAVVLRVRQDGSPADGNPFTPWCEKTPSLSCTQDVQCGEGDRCLDQVARYFAYGVRNGFGLAIDPATGDLWDTENGPFAFDEVNRVTPGFNSGWLPLMGPAKRSEATPAELFRFPGAAQGYADPAFSWKQPVAPTGIVFPIGSQLGRDYDDVALVADFNSGQLYRFPLNAERSGFDFSAHPELQDRVADDNAERDAVAIGSGFGALIDLEVGPDGALYATELFTGSVLWIGSICPAAPDPSCRASLHGRNSKLEFGPRADGTAWRWSWRAQARVPLQEFGDPRAGEAHAVCFYDRGQLAAVAGARPVERCGKHPCWRTSKREFRYRSAEPDDLERLRLRAGRPGQARIRAAGSGLRLAGATGESGRWTVQLHNTTGAACFGDAAGRERDSRRRRHRRAWKAGP